METATERVKLQTVKGVGLFWNAEGQQIAAEFRGRCEGYAHDVDVAFAWIRISDDDLSFVCRLTDRDPAGFLKLLRVELHQETIRMIRDASVAQ